MRLLGLNNGSLWLVEASLGVDGLLYCKKCGNPLEIEIKGSLIARAIKVSENCPCIVAELEIEEQRRLERERQNQIHINRSVCFHERRMQSWTFEHADATNPAIARAEEYVKNWDEMRTENIGLLLWGPVGTGKTYMAACIANALLDWGVKVLMTDFASISNISAFDMEEYVNALSGYDLLIVDDLGAERNSEFAIQNVFDVINRRCESGKPLIVTTNLTLDEMKKESDTRKIRIYDRILEMCVPICVVGDSRRKGLGQEKMAQLKRVINDSQKGVE